MVTHRMGKIACEGKWPRTEMAKQEYKRKFGQPSQPRGDPKTVRKEEWKIPAEYKQGEKKMITMSVIDKFRYIGRDKIFLHFSEEHCCPFPSSSPSQHTLSPVGLRLFGTRERNLVLSTRRAGISIKPRHATKISKIVFLSPESMCVK